MQNSLPALIAVLLRFVPKVLFFLPRRMLFVFPEPMTGQGVEHSELASVRKVIPDTPLLANTGVNLETVKDIFQVADGCVIGTHLKKDGNTWNPVDPERVKRFMDTVKN